MIRFTFSYLEPIALFLTIAIFFQCCKVYEKQPVTIEEAITVNPKIYKIRIDMVDGNKLILNSIYYREHGFYYSKKSIHREKIENSEFYKSTKYIAEIKIDKDQIVQIKLQNRKKSRVNTALIIIVPIFSLLLIITSSYVWYYSKHGW